MGSGDRGGDSLPPPPAGRFWARSPDSSDGEEESMPEPRVSPPFRYLCRTPSEQAGRDLGSGKTKRVGRSRAKVWAAQVL